MEYNATIKIIYRDQKKMVFRVFPDGLKLKYIAGQYGALGLGGDAKREDGLMPAVAVSSPIKRAYSVSSSIVNELGKVVTSEETDFYEFYIDLVKLDDSEKPRLSPRLFALKDNDRIFLGNKIVGHYHLDARPKGRNVLFIASTTGEAPHNSMIAELLKSKEEIRICHIVVDEAEWTSAYHDIHDTLMKEFSSYKYISLSNDKGYNIVRKILEDCLKSSEESKSRFGWPVTPENTHVYLCGDPQLIGAPVKLGGWQYEFPEYGLMRVLEKSGFQPATRFQPGNISYESYW